MAIDLSKTKRVVFFEIDRKEPHDLARFHRNISQLMAEGAIKPEDFEEVIGCYEGKMNVAYAMSREGFNRAFHRIEWYFRLQTELYDFDLDTCELKSRSWHWKTSWTTKVLNWAGAWAVSDNPFGEGWTYFPAMQMYFAILPHAQVEDVPPVADRVFKEGDL